MKTADQTPVNYQKKLAVFDLDCTLISANTSYLYLKNLYHKKIVKFSQFVYAALIKFRFYLTPMTLEKLHHLAFNGLLKGAPLNILEQHLDAFLQECLPRYLYNPAYQELLKAQERGDYIALFSSSPDFIVRKFASYFHIDLWVATSYQVDKEYRLCKIAKLVMGSQKQMALKELQKRLEIPKSQVIVYTDSHDDLPLLMHAHEPVAVNPDGKLARIAKKYSWRMI